MLDANDQQWLNDRLQDRTDARKAKRLATRTPGIVVIDAGRFAGQVADLADTLINKLEREGHTVVGTHPIREDLAVILMQLRQTYNLIRFINSEQTREENPAYRMPYSFVVLPLVRTMIDGFYNCTAMLDDPARVRKYRITGLYSSRESIKADKARYSGDPSWKEYLRQLSRQYVARMRAQGFTLADLQDKKNKWPLLGIYLDQKPDTPHRQMLRKLSHGFWKEYSSISHSSHDGLLSIMPFIAVDRLDRDKQPAILDGAERLISMHLGRAAGILLCLLTELQWFCRFDGARIDERLAELWTAMHPVYEVRELYDARYKSMLRHSSPALKLKLLETSPF